MNIEKINYKINCIHCDKKNLNVIHKNKFIYSIDKKETIEKIIDYSALYCSFCGKITNLLISDNNIISQSEFPMLPFSAYNIEIFMSECGLCGTFSLKEHNKMISNNDISEYNILKMVEYLEYYNICFEYVEDNICQFFFNKEKHKFLSNTSILNYIIKVFSNVGCNVTTRNIKGLLLDIYLDAEDFKYIISQSEQLSKEERDNLDPEYLDCYPQIIYSDIILSDLYFLE